MNSLLDSLKSSLLGKDLAELRTRARDQLRGVKVTSASRILELDGTSVEIVDEAENIARNDGLVDGYYLTQIVRNKAGEYFLLKTTDKAPFVKYLPQGRAKVVLKSKYQAPAGNASESDA